MRATNIDAIKERQLNVKNIRNICILAHVDHGKTTLADNLISSNGIISNRMAGKLRYMDSRDDEQLRGITMKSSAICLHHTDENAEDYLVNLIDSPGHVDFSSEVSTAVRLCDGAIVVVDVVEGVCPQTQAVLRQAWIEKLTPILVLNKIDRLITELKYSPIEAYYHLQQVLEQVNAVTGSLFSAEVMKKTAQKSEIDVKNDDGSETTVYDWSSGLEDMDDSNIYFSPDQGNVVFSSATDGWGFRIHQFAKMFSAKLNIRESILRKTLWGDYYVNVKAKKIFKGAQVKAKKPLFVQFILENLWSVYDAVVIRRDEQKSEKIINSLNLKISARDSRSAKTDPKAFLHAVCSQWLPLSQAVLSHVNPASVCELLPNPSEIVEERVEGLMCGATRSFLSLPPQSQALKQDFLHCDRSSDSTIVLISKMVSVASALLPQNRPRLLTLEELEKKREAARARFKQRNEERQANIDDGQAIPLAYSQASELPADVNDVSLPKSANDGVEVSEKKTHHFIAFARVFSGTLRVGQKMFVLGPKYDPSTVYDADSDMDQDSLIDSNPHASVAHVKNIYVWMGRELEDIGEAPAGSLIGIGGLEDHVLNSATLCNSPACPPFNALYADTSPILRVAVEPKNLGEMNRLVEGLRLLNQADPCVQVLLQDTGEHVIVAAGEVHLQRCLDDLRERFAKIELNASDPVVPFRETIVPRPKVDMMNELIGTQEKNMLAKWSQKDRDSTDAAEQSSGGTSSKKQATDKLGHITLMTPNKESTLVVRATPLPVDVVRVLEENAILLKVLTKMEKIIKDHLIQRRRRLESTGSSTGGADTDEQNEEVENSAAVNVFNADIDEDFSSNVISDLKVKPETLEDLRKLKGNLEEAFRTAGARKWSGVVDDMWAFGPRGNGPNILINRDHDYNRPSIWTSLEAQENPMILKDFLGSYRESDHSVVSGFQLATLSGPLCEEPVHGVCFVVEKWDFVVTDSKTLEDKTQENTISDNIPSVTSSNNQTLLIKNVKFADEHQSLNDRDQTDIPKVQRHAFGPLSGQLISTCKEACRKAFQAQSQRLMAAMYTCTIQATAEVLGKLYAVLGRREGRITSEELRDGSDSFDIEATLPVAESFGFAEELRKRTSGLASPQLVFSHWEVVTSDPFWIPTTEEEIQHFGEKADFANQAAKYMNSVRRRKGLFVEEKTVEHAEKQRTLSKNK